MSRCSLYLIAALSLVTALTIPAIAQSGGIIQTFAGNGLEGPNGDGGPAVNAALGFPVGGLNVDGAGNVYLNLEGPFAIRRIDAATAVITSLVGTEGATDFVVDPQGNVYFSCYSWPGRTVLRRDAGSGVITSFAGGNAATDFAEFDDPWSSNLFLVPLPTGDGGHALDAVITGFGSPTFDLAGNLYFVDGKLVRRIDAVTGIITTIAGNTDLVVEAVDGDPQNGFIIVGVASGDDGLAVNAGFEHPMALAINAADDLYIFDLDVEEDGDPVTHSFIRRIEAATGVISRFAGDGTKGYSGDGGLALNAALEPHYLAIDGAGNLFLSEPYTSNVIRRIDAVTGVISRYAGRPFEYGFSGDGGPADAAVFGFVGGLDFGSGGDLFIIDFENFRIRHIAPPLNTPAGTDIHVVQPLSDGTAVQIEFDQIDISGETTVTVTNAGQNQSPPEGFRFGTPPLLYQIETTAQFVGDIHVCFAWEEGRFTNESNLRLFHSADGSGWTDVTDAGYPDTVNNIICGTVSSFSFFALLERVPDRDGDGLSDDDELVLGTNPDHPDTDGDGLWDGTEIDLDTDPLNPDSDGDGLLDGNEVNLGTNPLSLDTDGDGWQDGIDPEPTVTNNTQDWLEEFARVTADLVATIDLAHFDAPNGNAGKGRRNALASRIRNAANAISRGDNQSAIALLDGVLARVDGIPDEPDWVYSGSAQEELRNVLILLMVLLGL